MVWRQAPLPVEEVRAGSGAGRCGRAVVAALRPAAVSHRRAAGAAAAGAASPRTQRAAAGCCCCCIHHLAIDHTTLEVLQRGDRGASAGPESELPAPLPFRNFVAQARLGVSAEEHERSSAQMLGDVDEPTAPFGLLDVQGDGTGSGSAATGARGRAGAAAARAGAAAGRERGEPVPSGVGAGAGAALGPRGRGVRHGAVRAHAGRRGRGPGDGAVHQHAAGADRRGRGGRARRRCGARTRCWRSCCGTSTPRWRWRSAAAAVPAPAPLFTALLNYRHSGRERRRRSQAGQPGEGVRSIRRAGAHELPGDALGGRSGGGVALTAQVAAPAEPDRVCRYMHTALERLVEALEQTPSGRSGASTCCRRPSAASCWRSGTRTERRIRGAVHPRAVRGAGARTPEAVAVVLRARSR